jgi:hypothetical protein
VTLAGRRYIVCRNQRGDEEGRRGSGRDPGRAGAAIEEGDKSLVGNNCCGKAATSKRLAARALEVEAGGVHEHQIERAEEIASPREQGLLHNVFKAARREGRGAVLLILVQFFAKPGHRAIEVMPDRAP